MLPYSMALSIHGCKQRWGRRRQLSDTRHRAEPGVRRNFRHRDDDRLQQEFHSAQEPRIFALVLPACHAQVVFLRPIHSGAHENNGRRDQSNRYK